MLIIGHRGASARLPENTLEAFRGAIDDGADGVELDVRLSADHRPVVIHDPTLKRTAGVRCRVSELTARELGAYGVPSLDETLELTGDAGAMVYVEVKGSGDGLVPAVARTIARHACHDRAVVLSFNHAALRRVRSIDERIATAATVAPTLGRPRPSRARIVEIVERAGARSAALHVSLATPRRVAALRDRGLGVAVWTVNRPAIARALGRYGVDAVMTDVPARLVRAVEHAV
jgi:glycerophosphoryl diester phosphodiesterase